MLLDYNHPSAVRSFLNNLHIKNNLLGLTKLCETFLKLPYENFTKIIHLKMAKNDSEYYRTPEVIWNEHKNLGAGGTCFSLTYFFETILKYVGFKCYPVMIDRSYGKNTHCAVITIIDNQKFLVDPGYCLSRPLPLLNKTTMHHLPHNTYVLTPADDNQYYLSTNHQNEAKRRYLLKDAPVDAETFLTFWSDSFSWPMMRHLCITKLGDSGYLYLRNRFLRHTNHSGKKQETIKHDYERRVSEMFSLSPKIVKTALEMILK